MDIELRNDRIPRNPFDRQFLDMRAEGTGVGKGVPTRDHSVKELKGDDESKEEWDRLKWGSLHGLAKDKRNGMKQRTMGKPICMWSSS